MRGEFIECKVWFIAGNQKEIELGFTANYLPEGDQWMPIHINLFDVSYFKLAVENEFIGDDKVCVTFKNGNQVTLDITYDKFKNYFVKVWQ